MVNESSSRREGTCVSSNCWPEARSVWLCGLVVIVVRGRVPWSVPWSVPSEFRSYPLFWCWCSRVLFTWTDVLDCSLIKQLPRTIPAHPTLIFRRCLQLLFTSSRRYCHQLGLCHIPSLPPLLCHHFRREQLPHPSLSRCPGAYSTGNLNRH